MDDRVEESTGVLHHGSICLEIDSDRSPVDVVWIRAAIGRTFSEHREFSVVLVITDDLLESVTFVLEFSLQLLECRRG